MTVKGTRVAVVRCSTYEQGLVDQAVREAVELALGSGWKASVREPVLVKPNGLSPRPPEDGVSTHPAVLRAVLGLLRDAGVQNVTVGESSGGSGTDPKAATEKALEGSGLARVTREAGVHLLSFDRGEVATLANPRGGDREPLLVAKAAVDAGWLISVPKFKTHSLTLLTAAVKNLFGTVPGLGKRDYHWRHPSVESFSELLLDIVDALQPDLHVVDAVMAMEGNGPSAGRLRRVGLILAGSDPVAVDAVLAAIVGLEPERVPTTRLGAERGLGVADLECIEVAGTPVAEAAVKAFRMPPYARVMARMPESLTRWGISLLRTYPAFVSDRCTRCGVCVANCPAAALRLRRAGPRLDRNRCISCLCCHELCPSRAVRIRRLNPLVRAFLRG